MGKNFFKNPVDNEPAPYDYAAEEAATLSPKKFFGEGAKGIRRLHCLKEFSQRNIPVDLW
jgi:hypothetical protein